jgi:DNA-binding phage protein
VVRSERDPAFAKALLDEAATLFLSDEPETARVILRDLVNATLGFEQLAKITATPSKSSHRMLSPKGNPSMDNLAAIFGAIGSRLKVGLSVHTVRRIIVAPASTDSLPMPLSFGKASSVVKLTARSKEARRASARRVFKLLGRPTFDA